MRRTAFLIAILLGVTCQAATCADVSTPPATGKPHFPPFGLSLDYIDATVKPGQDFFKYSNGGWLKTAQIPAARAYAGVNLELDLENEKRLAGLLKDLTSKPESGLSPEERKLRDLAEAFLDQARIDAAGLAPAKADLAMLATLKTEDDVVRAMANPALALDGPFGMTISVDQKNPSAYAVALSQSGLGMPDRDYYLKTDKDIMAAQAAYKTYLAQMLTFAGVPDAAARAAAIYALETEIAKASWPADERREEEKVYNPMPISALKKLAPQFPWDAYFRGAGVSPKNPKGERIVIVAEKSAFPELSAIFAKTPVPVWRDYLAVRYLHRFSAYLPQQIDAADFAFYGTTLQGNQTQLPRATRALYLLDGAMGEAFGKLYVTKYFPPEAKAKANTLVQNLLAAYAEDIKTLDWMSPETRTKALDKLSKYMLKVGYPDHWRDYSALEIPPGNLIQAVKNVSVFDWRRRLVRIDNPVDRTEWDMTPPTNNAYYEPTLNEIVFPAGILQPPFFDPNADDAVNYGEIGATIGHEISHGFDDQGSKYDGSGALKNWWTDSDRKNFDARTGALAKQYDAYQPLPGLHLNGKLTLGENIADLAGLVIAYKAYHISLRGKPAPVLNGLTGDQRFYLAYGQSWREIWRDGRTRESALADPHSPPLYRVNGVVRNDDGWYAAFPEVKSGDTFYLPPDQRVHLW
ncbi:MAG TPA: M13 family metallopeptidase [Rhizomicrobium sp.]